MPGSDPEVLKMLLVSAGVVFSLVLVIILFVWNYQRKLAGQKAQVQELEIRNQKELLAAAIDGQEAERKRIARDLHDDVGAGLSALRLRLSQRLRKSEDPVEQKVLAEGQEAVDDLIAAVRGISRGLLPPGLEQFGLESVLRDLESHINRAGGPLLQVSLPTEPIPLSLQQALQLLRICQECVNNSIRHSGAKHIYLSLARSGDKLRLRFRDDGKGLPSELLQTPPRGGGLGLRHIGIRTQLLGGSNRWENLPEGGCQLIVEAPLKPQTQSSLRHGN